MFFAIACGGTPTPTLPTITHALTVSVDPPEAGNFLLNPTPLDLDLYVRGRTVNIDALPKPGWSVDQWVGPVHDVAGDSAKVTMDSSKSVVIRLQRSRGGTPAGGPTQETSTDLTVYVRSITAEGAVTTGDQGNIIFTVQVFDANGTPVAGADFTGQVVTPGGRKDAGGKTGADGVGKVRVPVDVVGEHKFEVTNVAGAGLRYTPTLNLVNRATMQSNSASFTITPSAGKSGTDAKFELKTNRPGGDYIVRAQSGSTVKKGTFTGGKLTADFTKTMTGCKPNVLKFTARIRTLFGLVDKDASFTITAPPCKKAEKVHVGSIEVFYDYRQIDQEVNESTLFFGVEVQHDDGAPVSVAPVTVTGSIVGPDGSAETFNVLTDEFGRADFGQLVVLPGVYSFAVAGLSGDGIEHDTTADLATGVERK